MNTNLIYITRVLLLGLLVLPTAFRIQAQNLSLSMDDAVALSLEKNKTLQISKLETEKSIQRIKEARGYALPAVYASGQYLYFTQKQVSFLPGSFIGLDDSQLAAIRVGGKNSFLGGLNISQPLFQPVIGSRIRSEKIYNEMDQEDLTEDILQVVAEVKKAYLNVLIIQEQLKLQQQSIERNEMALKDARSLLAQGRASRVDTLRAFVNIENLRPEVILLTNSIEIGKTNLKRIIGLNEDVTIELEDSLRVSINQNVLLLEDAVEEAYQNRPDIRKMSLNKNYNKELVSFQNSERLPELSAVGAIQVQSQSNNFDIKDYAWPVSSFVGLQLNVPIFSGLKSLSKTKQAQISLLQSEKQFENLKDMVHAEVKINLSKVEEAESRIKVQQQTVSTAELGFQITNDRWKQGIASRLDLTDAELSLTRSKSNYLQALYDYLVANVELNKSLGRLGD